MQARLPGVPDALGYGLYLCAGLLTWNYFVEVLLRTQTVFLYPLVASYQQIILRRQWPPWSDLWSVCLVAAVFALISEALFRRLSGPMVDEL